MSDITKVVLNGTEYSTGYDELKNDFSVISENTRNLIKPNNTLDLYFTTENKYKSNANAGGVWIKCEKNTTYTISREAGTRFAAAYSIDFPTDGGNAYGKVTNYSGSSLTITTDGTAEYLYIWLYNAPTDTGKTLSSIIEKTQIETGSSVTPYIKPLSAIDCVLREKAFPHHGYIYETDNIDTIYKRGTYTVQATHYPQGTFPSGYNYASMLLVYEPVTGNTTTTIQFLISWRNSAIYKRVRVTSAWQTWEKIYDPLLDAGTKAEFCGAFTDRIAVSHGGLFTNSAYENSPKAFKEAREAGIIYQDLDVVFTSDFVPIIAHSSFADNAIRISDSDTSRIYFRDYTLAQLKENYVFGDSNYTWTIQTLKEAYEFNRDLGCYICIDVGAGSNNPIGSRETLISYMIDNGIECKYLVTSELDTFSILTASTGAERFPLGVVVAAYGESDTSSTDTTATAVSKINAIIAAKENMNLSEAWCAIRRERIETGGDLISYVSSLKQAGVLIEAYSYTATTALTAEIPSYVDAVVSQYVNVNYQRYLAAVG